MKIPHRNMIALFLALGIEPAAKWDVAKANKKLGQLLEVIDDPKQVDETQIDEADTGSKKLLAAIRAAKASEEEIEVVENPKAKAKPAPEPEAEETESESEAEAEAEEPAPAPAKKPAAKGKAKPAPEPEADEEAPAPAKKPAAAAKPAKKADGKPVKRTAFGARVDSNSGKVDACISKAIKTVDDIATESGVNRSTVNYRLFYLAKDGLITHVPREGYKLKGAPATKK